MMGHEKKTHKKPAIIVSSSDHDSLTRLAETHSSPVPEVMDVLLDELDRARIVADEKLDAGIVRMGSRLRFTSDLGEDRVVTLVFPGQADIATGRVSILTPIGVALIGLCAGQSIDWTARDGRVHLLTVEEVISDPEQQ